MFKLKIEDLVKESKGGALLIQYYENRKKIEPCLHEIQGKLKQWLHK